MFNLTDVDMKFIGEFGVDSFIKKRIQTGNLDDFDKITYFKSIPHDIKNKIAQQYIDSISFNGDCYTGTFGFCYDGSFRTGVNEIVFVDTYQNVIRGLGYSVSFNSWSNFGARGMDFKISKKREYTNGDMVFEKKLFSIVLLVLILLIILFFNI